MRTSLNGRDVKQACDARHNTGLVKGMAEQLITDLKKKHWVDFQTRFVMITMQLQVPSRWCRGAATVLPR